MPNGVPKIPAYVVTYSSNKRRGGWKRQPVNVPLELVSGQYERLADRALTDLVVDLCHELDRRNKGDSLRHRAALLLEDATTRGIPDAPLTMGRGGPATAHRRLKQVRGGASTVSLPGGEPTVGTARPQRNSTAALKRDGVARALAEGVPRAVIVRRFNVSPHSIKSAVA